MNTPQTTLAIGLARFGAFKDEWLESDCCLRVFLETYKVHDLLKISYRTFSQVLSMRERAVLLRIFPFFLTMDKVSGVSGWGWAKLFRMIDLYRPIPESSLSIYSFAKCNARVMSETLRRELQSVSTAYVAHVSLRSFLDAMCRMFDYNPIDTQVLVSVHEAVHVKRFIPHPVTPAEVRLFSTHRFWAV